ncbi:MAG: ATP-binding protein [Acidobacteriota bacterium]|nr:ATP-binding protein [Acidobacteriota bacterium]
MPGALVYRQNAQNFADLIDHVKDVFWVMEPGLDRVIYVSPAYELIWGRSCESLYKSPRSWIESIHPEDHERVLHSTRSQAASTDDYRILRPGGELRWVRARIYPVKNTDGEVIRIVSLTEDVTEWKRMEQQLIQSQKMDAVGRLAGGIAHDFNNLLTVMNGYSAMLEERTDLVPEVRADLSCIRKAGHRAAQLTAQLLAFSRKQILQPKVIDLRLAVAGVEPILRRLIREDVELTIVEHATPICLKADATQIEQVILNLVINARDAIGTGGTITIETSEEHFDSMRASMHAGCVSGDYAMLAVSDDGCGMDRQTQDRIFEPFFTTKAAGEGTGLGLATVYGIVKQSGGTIWVYSEEGIGTTFRVYLPSAANQDRQESPLPKRAPANGVGTILMVEDDENVRKIAASVLRARGYDVITAANGEEALEIVGDGLPALDLLVTDVIMPRMGGPELVARLSPIYPDLRVLYISGYTENAILPTGAVPSGTYHLPKPFTPDLLAHKVKELLEMKLIPA